MFDRGGQALPQARDVLLSLREHGVPHIFLTNGGGLRIWSFRWLFRYVQSRKLTC